MKKINFIFIGNATPEFKEKQVQGTFSFDNPNVRSRILAINGFVFLRSCRNQDFYRDAYGNLARAFNKIKGVNKRDKKLYELCINLS